MRSTIDSHVTPKELEELNSFAETVPRSSIFQTGLMAQVYSRSPDTQPLALVARGPSGGIIASIVGVTFSHASRLSSLSRPLSRHFTIRGAPLGAADPRSAEATQMLLRDLPGRLNPNTLYLRCYPDWEAPTVACLTPSGYVRADWLNIVIDLTETDRELLDGMSKHRRKGIRAAESAPLRLIRVSTPDELDYIYRLLADTHRRLLIPLQGRPLFNAIFREIVPKGNALMLMAATGDQILAGRIVLLYRGTAYDWYAGSTPQGKRLHADEWLVWRAMLLAKEHRAVRFDFGGAGEPDQDYGPREFKRRFGGPITNIGRYTKVLRRVRYGLVGLAHEVLGRI